MSLSVQLSHRFDGLALDLSFEAPMGVTALFGRSGAGKTTVINAVAGLLRPDTGRICVDGRVLLDTDSSICLAPHQRRIGYVFQDARLFPHLNVRQNLLYGRWFARSRLNRDQDFERIIALLGIAPLLSRRAGALSGGEKARVSLGRAMLADPQILLLDEPLAALDEDRKAEILPYLERLRDEVKLPILYVSHSRREVARLATTVVQIDAGRITSIGPMRQGLVGQDTSALDANILRRAADGMTQFATAGGDLWLGPCDAPIGTQVKLWIENDSIMIATSPPIGLSGDHLEADLIDAKSVSGATQLRLAIAGQEILARIPPRALLGLQLEPGRRVYLVLTRPPHISLGRGALG